MTNRREFLQIGVAATAWPIASTAVGAVNADFERVAPLPIYKTIYDKRFGDSVRFAERVKQLGIPVEAIDGDMTRIWFDDIYHLWMRAPIAIAGMTAHGPLFCFEQLARDVGMRTVFKAEHKRNREDVVDHEITGPVPMLNECAGLDTAGAEWSMNMARAIGICPSGRTEISASRRSTRHPGLVFGADTDALYSWIIAPAIKA